MRPALCLIRLAHEESTVTRIHKEGLMTVAKKKKWIGIVALLSLLVLMGCATPFPDSSRTGRIHDVNIENDVAPTELTVAIGDEIRWVNHRPGRVSLYFLNDVQKHLSCERGFYSRWVTRESSLISPFQGASLCFSAVGVYKYIVRMEANVPGGEIIENGSILVVETPQSGA